MEELSLCVQIVNNRPRTNQIRASSEKQRQVDKYLGPKLGVKSAVNTAIAAAQYRRMYQRVNRVSDY